MAWINSFFAFSYDVFGSLKSTFTPAGVLGTAAPDDALSFVAAAPSSVFRDGADAAAVPFVAVAAGAGADVAVAVAVAMAKVVLAGFTRTCNSRLPGCQKSTSSTARCFRQCYTIVYSFNEK
jgi:hypothetical protein